MLYNNWRDYCRNNKYSFSTLVTWENAIYLTYDLITKLWVIGKVRVTDEGIESCQYSDIQFFNGSEEAIAYFRPIMGIKTK